MHKSVQHKPNPKNLQVNGFSLIEIMIALAIISTGILALVHLQATIMQNEIIAQQSARANYHAQNVIEQFRAFDDLTQGSNSYANIQSGTNTIVEGSVQYTLAWTVTENSNPAYKNINVTTSWTGPDGENYSHILSSRIGKIDPALAGGLGLSSQSGTVTPP